MQMKKYIENGKISNRQTLRLFVFDLMGIATLLIPPYLSKLCGVDGIFAVFAGMLLGVIYLLYLGQIMRHMEMDIISYLNQRTRPLIRSTAFIFVLIHCLLTAGFCGYVFAHLMQYSLVPKSSFQLVLSVILIVAAYAVSGGIESRARVYEVLFWFVLIPYAGMMLASVKNFEWDYIAVNRMFETNGIEFGKGVYLVFLFFTPLFFSLFLVGKKEENRKRSYGKQSVKTILVSILIAGGILLGSYVLLLGNFGRESLADMRYPVVTLMSTIQFQGNFLKRMDSLMLAVWFFTLYALLNLHLHYGTAMMREIFSKGKKKSWQVVVTALLVFGAGYSMYLNEGWKWTFVGYYSYAAVPVLLIGPALVLAGKKKIKKSK